jgi:hypothetical protein
MTVRNPQPPWLYDLVTAVERHEDTHAMGDFCFDDQLAAIPLNVRHEARAIAAYNGLKPTHATDTEHGPLRAIARHEMDARDRAAGDV